MNDDGAQAFMAHVAQLAARAGVELDDDDIEAIGRESIVGGFNAAATEAAFESHIGSWDDDDEFDDDELEEADDEPDPRLVQHVHDDLERLSAERGRPLTGRETEIIARAAVGQAERFGMVDPEMALNEHYAANPGETPPDTGTEAGRSEYYRQRLAESQPAREVPDVIDMTTPEGRSQYYDARLNGGLGADDFEDAP